MISLVRTSACLLCTTVLTLCTSAAVQASDTRSLSLGGSAIANGAGVYGTAENPSTLVRLKNEKQSFHFHLGSSIDIQDEDELVNRLLDEQSLPDDIQTEIDNLSGQSVTCDIETASADTDTVCFTGTEQLGKLAQDVLNLMNDLDGNPILARASLDAGIAVTSWSIPVSFHYQASVVGSGYSDIHDDDIEYINAFANALPDNELTFGEILDSNPITLNTNDLTLTTTDPADVLQSDVQGSALLRQQFSISMATTIPLLGYIVDVGITPKISLLEAGDIQSTLSDLFDNDAETYSNQLDDSQVEATTYTLDIGASTEMVDLPLRLAAVGRNLVSESITTKNGYQFESTPQLIVGGAFDFETFTLTADVALNQAKVDNMDTQLMSVGIEFGGLRFGLRAGYGHDNARETLPNAFSLGLNLGPLSIAARTSGSGSATAALQLSGSF